MTLALVPPPPPETRGWKHHRGWLLRTRTRTGAEGKQKFDTYVEAKTEALKLSRGQFREIWIEEADVVPRAWRDLNAEKRQRQAFDDRAHVLNVEESD